MAYISKYSYPKDSPWSGPFPNKAGEFCGNTSVDGVFVGPDGAVVAMWDDENKAWREHQPPRFRVSLPSACPAGTTNQMLAKRFLGLYKLNDTPAGEMVGETRDVDTDVLTEWVVTGLRTSTKPFVPGVPMKPEPGARR